MANLCAGICSSLLVEKGAGYRGFARHRLRSSPCEGWQVCRGINGSSGVEQVAALPWNRWQDSPGIGGSFGVEYAHWPIENWICCNFARFVAVLFADYLA